MTLPLISQQDPDDVERILRADEDGRTTELDELEFLEDDLHHRIADIAGVLSLAGSYDGYDITFWPVQDGDNTVGGGIVTVDVKEPRIRLASLHQDWKDLIDDREGTGYTLAADIADNLRFIANQAIAQLNDLVTAAS